MKGTDEEFVIREGGFESARLEGMMAKCEFLRGVGGRVPV